MFELRRALKSRDLLPGARGRCHVGLLGPDERHSPRDGKENPSYQGESHEARAKVEGEGAWSPLESFEEGTYSGQYNDYPGGKPDLQPWGKDAPHDPAASHLAIEIDAIRPRLLNAQDE